MGEKPTGAQAFSPERVRWYDRAYDRRNANGYALRSRMEAVLRLLGPTRGSVLDAGMGPGRLCVELATRGWTVSGVDASPDMVAVARARLPEAAERLLVAEVEQLPFPAEAFDAVTATGVIEYSDVPRALTELARVLKPGGQAVVSYPNPRAYYGHWKSHVYYRAVRVAKRLTGRSQMEMPGGSGAIAPEHFTSLLHSHGLEPVDRAYSSYLIVPPPLEYLAPGLVVRLGHRLEGSGARVTRRVSTQVVYSARRT